MLASLESTLGLPGKRSLETNETFVLTEKGGHRGNMELTRGGWSTPLRAGFVFPKRSAGPSGRRIDRPLAKPAHCRACLDVPARSEAVSPLEWCR